MSTKLARPRQRHAGVGEEEEESKQRLGTVTDVTESAPKRSLEDFQGPFKYDVITFWPLFSLPSPPMG